MREQTKQLITIIVLSVVCILLVIFMMTRLGTMDAPPGRAKIIINQTVKYIDGYA